MAQHKYRFVTVGICALVISGCGSSGSSNNDGTNESNEDESVAVINTGVFIDSPVAGVDYSTETLDGTTNQDGEFQYSDGESVTFSIGDLAFPTITAAEIVSPVDMGVGANSPADTTANTSRLLQSIDEDFDPSNGINVMPEAKSVATPIDFDVPTIEFGENADVINLVANSGSSNTTLIGEIEAIEHLNESLNITGGNSGGVSVLAGFWSTVGNNDYTLISEEGSVTFYDWQESTSCYTTRAGQLSLVQGSIFKLDSEGESRQAVFTRDGDSLNILFLADMTLETSLGTNDLAICTN